jgi:hypothetical protein
MKKTRKTVKIDKPQKIPKEAIDKPQKIPKEAIDKYFIANTAEIFVPNKVVKIDNEGKIKLVKTLTKNKIIKKIKGKPVIKFEDKNIDNIVINQEGKKLIDKSKGILNDIRNKNHELHKETYAKIYVLSNEINNTKGAEKKKLQEKRKKLQNIINDIHDQSYIIGAQDKINPKSNIMNYNEYVKLQEIQKNKQDLEREKNRKLFF